MFACRLMEREKTNVDLKEKSSELTSEGASINGDDSGFNMMIQDDTSLLLYILQDLYLMQVWILITKHPREK